MVQYLAFLTSVYEYLFRCLAINGCNESEYLVRVQADRRATNQDRYKIGMQNKLLGPLLSLRECEYNSYNADAYCKIF